jgi:hypothetical protein
VKIVDISETKRENLEEKNNALATNSGTKELEVQMI